MPPDKVLIVSNPRDVHVERVCHHLRRLGGKPILFCPELLGTTIDVALNHTSAGPDLALKIDQQWHVLKEFRSAWFRRPRAPQLKELTGIDAIEFAGDEWLALMDAVYALAEPILWVSHPDRLRLAARKPLQLAVARRAGLRTPRTLITNDPMRARAFVDACGGQVVAKSTGKGWLSDASGDVQFVLTNRISWADVRDVDEIRVAPVTFQEEIKKAYEVRVNVVGRRALAIRIDSQSSERSSVDWRRYDLANTPYTEYKLPPDVEAACLQVVQKLGLEFGAIDMIRRPDGEYYFLEVNGNGQFLWSEDLSGVQVSAAVAALLMAKEPALCGERNGSGGNIDESPVPDAIP